MAAGGTAAEFDSYDIDESNTLDKGELEARAKQRAQSREQALHDVNGGCNILYFLSCGMVGGGEGDSQE